MSQEETFVEMKESRSDVTVWEYNGFTFELDVGDADTAEHIEGVFDRFSKAEKRVKRDGSMKEIIISYDKLFRDMFDDMFGTGAGDDILGEKRSIKNCNAAYESFLDFINAQRENFAEQNAMLNAKYNGNRVQRRTTAKNSR